MLDLAKLEKTRKHGSKIVCACPACREAGGDKAGDHLAVFESGAFNCVVDQSAEHRKRIWQLAGERVNSAAGLPPIRRPLPAKPIQTPRKAQHPFPALRPLKTSEMARICETRRWPLFAGLEMLTRRGLLWYASIRGHDAWLVCDSSRRNAQARRIDGLPWWGEVKAYSLAQHLDNFAHDWPIGASDIGDRPDVWICEGQPDFCAALLLAWWGGLDASQIAPVAMTGAGLSIHPDALPLFRGKRVSIAFDADPAGHKAAARWAEQLREAGAASVQGLDVAKRIMPGGSPCKDLADFATTLTLPDDCEPSEQPR